MYESQNKFLEKNDENNKIGDICSNTKINCLFYMIFYNVCFIMIFIKDLKGIFQRVAMTGKKVCIVGSGNWGSAIAKLAGQNAAEKEMFDNQ